MLLQQDFEGWAAQDSDRVALVCGPKRYTYGELGRRSQAVAGALRKRGIRRGDRVALFLDNGVDFVAGMVASLTLGAVFMPINPSTKEDKLAYMLGDARASALLTHESLSQVWAPAVASTASLQTVLLAGSGSQP